MNRKQYARQHGKKGQDRYGVQRVKKDGESYRSGLEVTIHRRIEIAEEEGEYKLLHREDHVRLGPAKFLYIPDFKCQALRDITILSVRIEKGEVFWIEAKGAESETWRRNYRLWKIHGPGKLVIYRGYKAKHKLTEVLVPKGGHCEACGQPLQGAS